jgi:hypothetical protein
VDFKETWAPTGSLAVLRCLFAYAATYDYDIIQADIRTAFLNGPLDVEIYLSQPPGFGDGSNRVWKLHKALYGLRKGASAWYLHLRDFLHSIGYHPMQADPASFVKIDPKLRTFIFTHVDDILLSTPKGNSGDMHKILQRFEGKLFGEVKFFLGMNCYQGSSSNDTRSRPKWSDQRTRTPGRLQHHQRKQLSSATRQNAILRDALLATV